jgi:hypothetical protein
VSANGAPGLSSDELRAAVRAVIREVMPDAVAQGGSSVTVNTDAELDALVRRVAEQCEDPATRAAYREGRHGLRLAGASGGLDTPLVPRGYSTSGQAGVTRVERGAVTERAVLKAAKAGSRLVLGPKAVLTPLARDRARVLGVEIEKES